MIIHDLLHHDIEHHVRVTSIQYNIYCVCSRIGQQKKLVMSRCVSFVDCLLAAFCCNLRSSCREAGSQSSCASSHRKLVDKAVCLAVEGTEDALAMQWSSSTSSLQSGTVTAFIYYLSPSLLSIPIIYSLLSISFPSPAVREFLV